MRKVVLRDDIPSRLAPNTLAIGEDYVKQAGGRIEVVDYVRRVTFKLYQDYFGIPDPPGGTLPVWATRLFEFQFADGGNDKSLRAEVDDIAPRLRTHIDGLIAKQKSASQPSDDVLGRCVVMGGKGEPGFDDLQIRTALMGFIVGGPPQPPMVAPQSLEQLLRRPDALAGACKAARADDDKLLAGYVFEAMRFDPLAPFMPRVAKNDAVIAEGTEREIQIPKGTSLMVAFSSAMMDERRLRTPKTFDPHRLAHEYIHFGYGLHQCFGIYMNLALLPLMLKPLLKRRNLRRASGAEGKLRKNGVFAERLWVEYDA
jgi:cytochrome P450